MKTCHMKINLFVSEIEKDEKSKNIKKCCFVAQCCARQVGVGSCLSAAC
jgi:hypothetical protein